MNEIKWALIHFWHQFISFYRNACDKLSWCILLHSCLAPSGNLGSVHLNS